ncbi:MAG: hypothetical protein WC330_01035 [Candidatus Omnitrophota bacterium]|jgi:hypothetical protein
MRRIKKIFAVVFILSIAIYIRSHAQQSLDSAIEMVKNDLLRGRAYHGMQIYNAVNQEDLSLCQRGDCKANAAILLNFRYMGEKKCAKIKDPLYNELCNAVNSSCDSVAVPWKKDYCNGMVKKDISLLEKATKDSGIEFNKSAGVDVTREEAAIGLAVYEGYKRKSVSACRDILKNERMPILKKEACNVIFASNPNNLVASLMNDLAILGVSRKTNDSNLCNRIADPDLKNSCRNKAESY